MEWSPQANSSESNVENIETLGLKKPIEDFLKSKGIDTEVFKPVVTLNPSNGFLSIEIFENGKSIFNGYSTPEPFRVGKEKIIEGAKEAIGYWIESNTPVMEDMNEIREDTKDQLEKIRGYKEEVGEERNVA